MKRFITYIILASYLLACIPASAGDFDNARIDLVQDVDDITGMVTQRINISGTAAAEFINKLITIGIIEESLDKSKATDYQVVKQIIADSAGGYSIAIPFQSGGSYIIRISSELSSEVTELALTTASADTINEFMNDIKYEYDKTELNLALLANGEDLGFDLTIYNGLSQTKQEAICEEVLSDARMAPMQEIKAALSSNCAVIAISNQSDKSIVLDTLSHYEDLYSFGSDGEYNVFSNGSSELKNYVAQKLGSSAMETPADVKNVLYEYTALYDIYDIEIDSEMISNISTYSSYITPSVYSSFSGMNLTQKTNVAGYLKQNKAESMSDFNSKLLYVITNYNELYPSVNEGTTVGGNSSSSSSVALPLSPSTGAAGNVGTAITVSFDDLDDVQWAEEAILSLLDKKVVNGKQVGKFCPNDNVTRAEFVKMLMLAFGITADNSTSKTFDDVPASHWAYEYVTIASSKSLVNGISQSEFGVDNFITREDMATLGYRVLSYFGGITGGQSLENKFSDSISFSDYAINGILMLNNEGYLNGYPDGSFKPKNNVTRAEAAQLIYNLIKERS